MDSTTKEFANENIQDIELIDIEDITPPGGNSLFLSCARAILYMSHKNLMFMNAFNACCNIDLTQVRTDIALQGLLRQRLCEYFCDNGVVVNRTANSFSLREEYSKYFNSNIYDYLIQVYQLSINNFSHNSLYKKYALGSLSQLLNMKIYYKRANGQWKMYEPFTNRLNDKNLRKIVSEQYLNSAKLNLSPEKQSLMDYLNQFTIYLQEFRTEAVNGHAGYANKKVIRILLNKKIWVQKYAENSKICMKFAQFNDEMELRSYQRQYFTINPKQITDIFTERTQDLKDYVPMQLVDLSQGKTVFCVFLHSAPVQLILNENSMNTVCIQSTLIDTTVRNLEDFEFSQAFNTIGKQIARFEVMGIDKLYQYLNHLWGKVKFNNEFVLLKFSIITGD